MLVDWAHPAGSSTAASTVSMCPAWANSVSGLNDSLNRFLFLDSAIDHKGPCPWGIHGHTNSSRIDEGIASSKVGYVVCLTDACSSLWVLHICSCFLPVLWMACLMYYVGSSASTMLVCQARV